MAKDKKTIWEKITHLSKEDLKREGKEVGVISQKKEVHQKEKQPEETWLPETSEGKLSLDIYRRENLIIVQSALAGVKSEDLEITIDKDILTIKGERQPDEEVKKDNYFLQECFWGRFSRTVILPTEVKTGGVKAQLRRNGILTITLPIKKEEKEIKKVEVKN